MTVVDMTAECRDGNHTPLSSRRCSTIWIHRCGPSIGQNAIEIARWFRTEGRRWTGANMPYHVVVTQDEIQQALPFDEQGAHARRWGNAHGLAIAALGDFNKDEPTREQWYLAVHAAADLVPLLVPHKFAMAQYLGDAHVEHLPIFGHGEIPGAYGASSSKRQPDGEHACPGRHWPMHAFRADVGIELRTRAAIVAANKGYRISGDPGLTRHRA